MRNHSGLCFKKKKKKETTKKTSFFYYSLVSSWEIIHLASGKLKIIFLIS